MPLFFLYSYLYPYLYFIVKQQYTLNINILTFFIFFRIFYKNQRIEKILPFKKPDNLIKLFNNLPTKYLYISVYFWLIT